MPGWSFHDQVTKYSASLPLHSSPQLQTHKTPIARVNIFFVGKMFPNAAGDTYPQLQENPSSYDGSEKKV